MEDRALAGAGSPDDRQLLAGADAKRDVLEHHPVFAGRIGESHVLELDLAAARHRKRGRVGRAPDSGLDWQELRDAFGGPRCERNFAPDLAQLAERTRREYRIEQELAEAAGA